MFQQEVEYHQGEWHQWLLRDDWMGGTYLATPTTLRNPSLDSLEDNKTRNSRVEKPGMESQSLKGP